MATCLNCEKYSPWWLFTGSINTSIYNTFVKLALGMLNNENFYLAKLAEW
jgi:hypothetical protein